MQKWKVLSSELALDNSWYKVRKDRVEIKSGKEIDYYVGVFPDVSMVLAITPDKQVPLVRQYKHGIGDLITELPAGLIDEGEDPLEAAKRELREESGYTSDDWQVLGYFSRSPGKTRGGNIYVYLAQNAQKTSNQEFDENEEIEVLLKLFSEALKMAKAGEFQGMDTIAAILLAEGKIK